MVPFISLKIKIGNIYKKNFFQYLFYQKEKLAWWLIRLKTIPNRYQIKEALWKPSII